MSKTNKYEVIIVGAGPAGLSAAKVLAKAGINTIVLEKNKTGAKNFFSGIVSEEPLKEIFTNFYDTNSKKINAPFERFVDQFRAYMLQETSFTSFNVQSNMQNSYLVLRESFNQWLFKEVEQAGGKILTPKVITELIIKDGKVIGVKTNDEEFFADVVVIGEGASSVLTKSSGLRTGELQSNEVFIFAEENIVLSPKIIEERFNLSQFNGMVAKLFTQGVFNIPSIGYIYTNHSSILLGVGVLFSESISKELNINHALEILKEHPGIKPLVTDGITNKYGSYILPIASRKNQNPISPKLVTNGCLLVGASATLVDIFSWDTSKVALLSGKAAAEAIIQAKENNDFSYKGLSCYLDLLTKNVLPDILTTRLVENSKDFNVEIINNLSSLVLEGNK